MTLSAGQIPTAEELMLEFGRVVVKPADEPVTSSTVLQSDDHLLFAGAANTKYKFRLVLFVTGSINGDIKVGFTFPSGVGGATIHWAGYGIDVAAVVQTGAILAGAFVNSTTVDQVYAFSAHGSGTMVMAEGYIEFGSVAGNLTLRWAQNTSNATATVVLKGSSLEYREAS